MNKKVERIIFDIFLIIACGLAPWWITLPLAVGGFLYFPHFYELIIVGAVIDSLYNFSTIPWTTLITIVLFIILHFVRGILRVER